MSVKKSTAVNICVFNVTNSRQVDVFVRIKQTESPNISRSDVSFLQVTSPCTSLRMYGSRYSHGMLSVPFHPVVSPYDVITRSTGGMTVGS